MVFGEVLGDVPERSLGLPKRQTSMMVVLVRFFYRTGGVMVSLVQALLSFFVQQQGV